MTATAPRARDEDRAGGREGSLLVWFGFLGAPVAWLVHLVAMWALVPVACEAGGTWPLHLATLVTGAVAVAATLVARRQAAGPGPAPAFLGRTGWWLGVLFVVLILLEELPVFLLDPCG